MIKALFKFAFAFLIVGAAWYGAERTGWIHPLGTIHFSNTVLLSGATSTLADALAHAPALAAVEQAIEKGPVSITDLRNDYASLLGRQDSKVKILIVPGHEPDYGGAQFGSTYERNLVAEIGADLDQYLTDDGSYQVAITRTAAAWNPVFADYFKSNWSAIVAWEQASRRTESKLSSLGRAEAPKVDHITVPDAVAIRLYGITKWANANGVDLMIHLHLNDYPGHGSRAGKYSGLVIYTPATQYANSSTTRAVAITVFHRLALYNPIDNLPVESGGVIDDPELIAVGANNTSDAASMLIEYDYIYEPQFTDARLRSLALKDLAYQTYLGLQDFFDRRTDVAANTDYYPATLYDWKTPVRGDGSDDPRDVYALQTALILDGDYPPSGKSRNECPHSGFYGACTSAAVREFQKKYEISGEGPDGKKTTAILERIYDRK